NDNLNVNSATINNHRGGGLYLFYAHPKLSNLLIVNNSAVFGTSNGQGGGMYLHFSSPIMESINFVANKAYRGAGLYRATRSSKNFNIINSNFINNKSSDNGGGFYSENVDTFQFINTNWIGNYSGNYGGGLYSNDANAFIE